MKRIKEYISEKLIVNNTIQNQYPSINELNNIWVQIKFQFFISGAGNDYIKKIKPIFCDWIKNHFIKNIDQLEFYIYSTSQETLDEQKKIHKSLYFIKPQYSLDIDKVEKTIKDSDKIFDDFWDTKEIQEEYYFCNSEYIGIYWSSFNEDGILETRNYKVAKVK